MPDRVTGAALFADISGFTPLTEALAAELGARRGAEELTAALDLVFDAVLGELHRFGGSVISFAGDAVTCWLDGDDGFLGVSCALAMQQAMARAGTVTTPGGTTVELGMKVAVAAGPARRFVVGDPAVQLIDVLAGALMDRLAGAEHHAERGEVVVDAATLSALGTGVEVARSRGEGAERVGVVTAAISPAARPPTPATPPRLPRAVVRRWLLPAVYDRLRAGGEFLSELRPAVPMFVRFGGIDYDAQDAAPRLLDDFVRRAQSTIAGHGGNLLQLTIGDKGAYLYAVFGSPLAHEDDAARACDAALDVLALEGTTAATELQVGIASGGLRSGTYGHRQRRTFCCLGDAVNLAARLMSAAPPGDAYVTAGVARAAAARFDFDQVGDLPVKGKAAPVAASRIAGRSATLHMHRPLALHPVVGRAGEIDRMVALAGRALAGEGQVLALRAEAGMGKSSLAAVLTQVLEDRGGQVLAGAAASVGSSTSYLAWQPVAQALFGPVDAATRGAALARLERRLAAAGPDLVPRLPLLGALLGTSIDDNELTASFDAKLRKTSLESLFVQYLAGRAAERPLVVVLEDCHWLDQLSADLLGVVARAAPSLPLLVLLTYRPGPFSAPALDHTTVVELDRLDEASCRAVLTTRLAELYGPGAVPSDALVDRLVERAEGNPFYLGELANYLHDTVTDPSDAAAASIELPSSLATLVLSRIDTLGESARRTLKVASVVGREFAAGTLSGAYPPLGQPRQVERQLRRLCAEALVVHEDRSSDAYAFTHAVIQEVAYESLPFALRASVHGRIGAWLESAHPDALDLLAHHFWCSRDEEKKREYLLRAGEAARARFANEAAADYFRRLATLLPDSERPPVLLQLGAVLELPGEWAAAEEVYSTVLALAEAAGDGAGRGRARLARAEPLRKQGRYEEATAELAIAERLLAAVGDGAGLGRVEHVRGLVANQQGSPAEAWDHFQRSLEIHRALGDSADVATALANLAISAANTGDYELARGLTAQSLDLRTELGDRWGVAVSENNLGMIGYLRHDYAGAIPHLADAFRGFSEIGDLLGIATCLQNLGNCRRELGDAGAARGDYARALGSYAVTGDRWLLATMVEDVAMLVADEAPAAACRLLGAAEAAREAIGARRVDHEEAEIARHLRGARERLGVAATREQAAGRALDLGAARELALGLCRT